MSEVTYFVALPFVAADDGIAPGEAVECLNPNAAVMRADALSRKPGHVGAVAFSRTGDPATGDFSDAKVIRKFGNVPDDFLGLFERMEHTTLASMGGKARAKKLPRKRRQEIGRNAARARWDRVKDAKRTAKR